MSRPAETGTGTGAAVLEDRVRRLEDQMEAIAEALDVLTRGIEEVPTAEPGERHVEDAARRAHEILLLAKSPAQRREG